MIDGELVALGKHGVSHFQLLQNALRHEANHVKSQFTIDTVSRAIVSFRTCLPDCHQES